MELPTVWGNVKCVDGVGGVGWCNGTCDGWSVWRSMWRSMWRNVWRTETVTETVTGRGCDGGVVVWERQFQRVSPDSCGVHEQIFQLAHDSLGHFGFSKTYKSIRSSYFWPNMHKDLEEGYVPSCMDCQCNKSLTSKPAGPLHPLPVPDKHCDSVALDFIGPLPVDNGFDYVLTITDRLNSDIWIIPTSSKLTAEKLAIKKAGHFILWSLVLWKQSTFGAHFRLW